MKHILLYILSLFVALTVDAQKIIFDACAMDKAPLNGQVISTKTGFKLSITDTYKGGKQRAILGTAYFGMKNNYKKFDSRITTSGPSSDENALTLTIPKDGTLSVYARSGNRKAFDRNLILRQDGKALCDTIIMECDSFHVQGLLKELSVYNIISVPVKAGTVNVEYPHGSLSFYCFEFNDITIDDFCGSFYENANVYYHYGGDFDTSVYGFQTIKKKNDSMITISKFYGLYDVDAMVDFTTRTATIPAGSEFGNMGYTLGGYDYDYKNYTTDIVLSYSKDMKSIWAGYWGELWDDYAYYTGYTNYYRAGATNDKTEVKGKVSGYKDVVKSNKAVLRVYDMMYCIVTELYRYIYFVPNADGTVKIINATTYDTSRAGYEQSTGAYYWGVRTKNATDELRLFSVGSHFEKKGNKYTVSIPYKYEPNYEDETKCFEGKLVFSN